MGRVRDQSSPPLTNPCAPLVPPLRRSVGLLTKGLINRAQYYDHALTLSLVPFRHGDLYP